MSNDQPVQSTSSTEGQDNVKTDSILPDSTMTCFIPKTETSEMDKDKYSKEQYCDEEIFPKLRIKTTELLENMTKEEMESLTLKKLRMLLCNIMPEYYDYMMRSETKNFLKDIFGKVFQSINKKHSDEVENKREADKNLRIKTGRDTNPNSNDGQKHAKMTIESTVEKIDADSHLLPNVLLKQKARKSKPKKSTHINADEVNSKPSVKLVDHSTRPSSSTSNSINESQMVKSKPSVQVVDHSTRPSSSTSNSINESQMAESRNGSPAQLNCPDRSRHSSNSSVASKPKSKKYFNAGKDSLPSNINEDKQEAIIKKGRKPSNRQIEKITSNQLEEKVKSVPFVVSPPTAQLDLNSSISLDKAPVHSTFSIFRHTISDDEQKLIEFASGNEKYLNIDADFEKISLAFSDVLRQMSKANKYFNKESKSSNSAKTSLKFELKSLISSGKSVASINYAEFPHDTNSDYKKYIKEIEEDLRRQQYHLNAQEENENSDDYNQHETLADRKRYRDIQKVKQRQVDRANERSHKCAFSSILTKMNQRRADEERIKKQTKKITPKSSSNLLKLNQDKSKQNIYAYSSSFKPRAEDARDRLIADSPDELRLKAAGIKNQWWGVNRNITNEHRRTAHPLSVLCGHGSHGCPIAEVRLPRPSNGEMVAPMYGKSSTQLVDRNEEDTYSLMRNLTVKLSKARLQHSLLGADSQHLTRASDDEGPRFIDIKFYQRFDKDFRTEEEKERDKRNMRRKAIASFGSNTSTRDAITDENKIMWQQIKNFFHMLLCNDRCEFGAMADTSLMYVRNYKQYRKIEAFKVTELTDFQHAIPLLLLKIMAEASKRCIPITGIMPRRVIDYDSIRNIYILQNNYSDYDDRDLFLPTSVTHVWLRHCAATYFISPISDVMYKILNRKQDPVVIQSNQAQLLANVFASCVSNTADKWQRTSLHPTVGRLQLLPPLPPIMKKNELDNLANVEQSSNL